MSKSPRIPKRWYRRVSEDLTVIPDALEYYMTELDAGFADVEIKGNLIRENQAQGGFVAYYDAMHSDLDGILSVVERNEKTVRGAVFREMVENGVGNKPMNGTELKLIMEADQRVIDAGELVTEVKYVYKQYSSLLKAFEKRGFSLTNITKLRVANMEEVEV